MDDALEKAGEGRERSASGAVGGKNGAVFELWPKPKSKLNQKWNKFEQGLGLARICTTPVLGVNFDKGSAWLPQRGGRVVPPVWGKASSSLCRRK